MKLELLHLKHCPYSAKVRKFISENNLTDQIEYREIEEDEEAGERLVELTGGEQVPCLVIDDKPMLESDDIISWLKTNILSGDHQSSEAG